MLLLTLLATKDSKRSLNIWNTAALATDDPFNVYNIDHGHGAAVRIGSEASHQPKTQHTTHQAPLCAYADKTLL